MVLLKMPVFTYLEKDPGTLRMLLENKPVLILASSSLRRQELLRTAGVPFEVHSPNIKEERTRAEPTLQDARRRAGEKAQAVEAQYPQHEELSAATIGGG